MTLLSNEGGMGITADNELYRPRSAMFCHASARASGLSRWADRCFAALSMTIPVLIGKNHSRPSVESTMAAFIRQWALSAPMV